MAESYECGILPIDQTFFFSSSHLHLISLIQEMIRDSGRPANLYHKIKLRKMHYRPSYKIRCVCKVDKEEQTSGRKIVTSDKGYQVYRVGCVPKFHIVKNTEDLIRIENI